jgi:peptidyl-prolyl cis-trans isomerase A (cyclophilin A)
VIHHRRPCRHSRGGLPSRHSVTRQILPALAHFLRFVDNRGMKNVLVLLLFGVVSMATAQDKPLKKGTYAHFETSLGTFTAQLETQLAPKTVANFVGLAQGTKEWKAPKTGQTMTGKPYYDGLIFHRVVDSFIIQSGDPTGAGTGGPGFTIPDEFSPQLTHDGAGILSMANRGPNSGGGQFFVTLQPMMDLNRVNAAFGRIVRGLDVVRKIGSTRTRNERPVTPVVLLKVRIEVVP